MGYDETEVVRRITRYYSAKRVLHVLGESGNPCFTLFLPYSCWVEAALAFMQIHANTLVSQYDSSWKWSRSQFACLFPLAQIYFNSGKIFISL